MMKRLTIESPIKDSYVLNPQENIPKVIVEGMIYDKLGKLEDLEQELDMPLDKVVDLLFKSIENSEFYDCLTCTNVMHNERGCDGNCSHNREFSRKEILELLELEEKFRGK